MNKSIEAIVLAGGRGERLRPFTDTRQKCLLPVSGEPVLYWVVSSLISAFGSVDLKVAVQYKKEQVINFLDHTFSGSKRISLTYIPHCQGAGTLGAYKSMVPFVQGQSIGLPGDVLATATTYHSLVETHTQSENDLTLTATAKLETVDSHGIIRGKDGDVKSLEWPKPYSDVGLRDMNIYSINKNIMTLLETYFEQNGAFTRFLQHILAKERVKIGYYESHDSFVHIAYAKDLEKAVAV